MPAADLYVLTDDMARLAIAAAALLEDSSRRALNLRISMRASMLLISCDVSYASGADLLSDTTGLRSLKLLAEKNGGSLQAAAGGSVATLEAIMPVGMDRSGR